MGKMDVSRRKAEGATGRHAAYPVGTMSDPDRSAAPGDPTQYSRFYQRAARLARRRARIRTELERNRRGEYRLPTWALALLLVAILAAWAALIFLM